MENTMGAELAIDVCRWAKTPGEHGINPYFFPMVKRARAILVSMGINEDDIKPAEDFRELTTRGKWGNK